MKRKFRIDFNKENDHSIDYLSGILEDARFTTLQRLESLPLEELHWQYKEGWNTIGVLLSHIIAIENYFRIIYIERRELTKEETEKWLPGLEMGKYIPQLINDKPVQTYIAELAESRQLFLEALDNLSFEDFSKRIDDYDEETGCNLAWVLYHFAEDELHHRGQISILRKLYKEN